MNTIRNQFSDLLVYQVNDVVFWIGQITDQCFSFQRDIEIGTNLVFASPALRDVFA